MGEEWGFPTPTWGTKVILCPSCDAWVIVPADVMVPADWQERLCDRCKAGNDRRGEAP